MYFTPEFQNISFSSKLQSLGQENVKNWLLVHNKRLIFNIVFASQGQNTPEITANMNEETGAQRL